MLSASRPTTARSAWTDQKTLGRDDFSKIPNGGPGIENRLQMIHHFGVRDGRLTLNRMVELSRPTRRSSSACIRARARSPSARDADIVVLDPEKQLTLSAATHHSNVDYNLFEGTEVVGAPEVVLVRGHVVVENDELVASPGIGRFLRRARFGKRLALTPEAGVAQG